MSFEAAIIGLGYVGMPLARAATRAGLSVLGFDIDHDLVVALNAGRSHVGDVSEAEVVAMRKAGFRATADPAEIGAAAVAMICVPTPLSEDHRPDLAAVVTATRTVAEQLRPGMLVVLESTTYPGTTDEVVRPILEETGLVAGRDFHLAFSPERIDPGNSVFDPHNTPKVVGGHTPGCTRRAADFYRRFVRAVVCTRGTREAETAKLLENTYRHVNIALVNELARLCHELDIDVWDVIRAAATKPFGFQAFYPGPGVGGHCIPIDPNFLSHTVRVRLGYPFRFVELAHEINATMPGYVAQRAQNLLNRAGVPINGAAVLLLGVTFKPNVADQRGSPAVRLARHLCELEAAVSYHDPLIKRWQVPGLDIPRAEDLDGAVASADLVILLQDHREYDVVRLAGLAKRFFDTRGVTSGETCHRL